jgi:hypothetical protein
MGDGVWGDGCDGSGVSVCVFSLPQIRLRVRWIPVTLDLLLFGEVFLADAFGEVFLADAFGEAFVALRGAGRLWTRSQGPECGECVCRDTERMVIHGAWSQSTAGRCGDTYFGRVLLNSKGWPRYRSSPQRS